MHVRRKQLERPRHQHWADKGPLLALLQPPDLAIASNQEQGRASAQLQQ